MIEDIVVLLLDGLDDRLVFDGDRFQTLQFDVAQTREAVDGGDHVGYLLQALAKGLELAEYVVFAERIRNFESLDFENFRQFSRIST